MLTLGSAGDVHPFIGIGQALARKGDQVRIAANPYFQERITGAGLGFEPIGTVEEYTEVICNPRLVNQFASPKLIIDELIHKSVRPTIELTERMVREWRPDVIVRHHISLGSRWVAERHGIPTATIALAPAFFFSRIDPVAYRSWESLAGPPWLANLKMQIAKRVMRWFMDRPLNEIARETGYEQGRDFLFHEVTGGDTTLGMWSKHLRDRAPDDPENSHICGYSFFDRSPGSECDAGDLDEFLSRCERSGKRPAVFTLGSSVVHHAGNFYQMATAACRKLGIPAVLLVGKKENAPTGLPDSIRAFTYAPFSDVLPRGAVTIHHGGAGTTAQGLRSGRPTIIIPFVNDEFDNAARAERMGSSITLKRGRLNERTLVECLDRALNDREMQMRAEVYRGVLEIEDGAGEAAARIRQVAEKSNAPADFAGRRQIRQSEKTGH